MDEKKLNRREFLKAALAAAAAVGLSHFRFLNLGGVNPVLADVCDSLADYCNPMEDLDICPDPTPSVSSDVCIPEMEEWDECMPSPPWNEPDICDLMDFPPDICDPEPSGDPDECEVPPGGPDVCFPQPPSTADICPDGPLGDGDICHETAPDANPDECIPAVGESDGCTVSAEPDFCRDPGSGEVAHDICNPPFDPDICMEEGQNVVDVCAPPDDPDRDPNAIGLTSFAASSALPALGAAAAALGLAALRKRSKDEDAKESA